MKTYVCSPFRPIRADALEPWANVSDAARIFAKRRARKVYGKRGDVHHVRPNSWTEDGRSHTFEAFIGVPNGDGMSGRNEWLTVTVRE